MGGTSKTSSQNQQQAQSTSAPWQQAQPDLLGILSGIQTQLPNYQPNATENAALGQLTSNEQGVQNFAPQAQNIASSYLGGDPTGLLTSGLQNYQNRLAPITGASLDPTQTPGIQNLLSTIRSDVGNSVNQQFAGAGRDLSGENTQALARGISQGEAAPLLGQYNANVSNLNTAASNLYGAQSNTASAIGGNQAQGFNFAGMVPGLAAQGPNAVLQAQAAMRGLPLNNLGMLANLTVPIAGLGGQVNSSGTSNTQGTQTMSGAQQFGLLSDGLKNLFGAGGVF